MGRGNNSNLLYGSVDYRHSNDPLAFELKELFSEYQFETEMSRWLKALNLILNFDKEQQIINNLYQ
jgi:hypothetical protein